MEENWRDVPGYEGLYQISIDTKEGRCRSLNYWKTKKTKELSNKPKKGGHRSGDRIWWTLCKNGEHKFQQAARWIALTYPELVENKYFEGAVIDHKDTDTLNNHPQNLKWVTPKENCNNPLTLKHLSKAQKGKKVSEETRRKMSNAQKGEKHWFYGKHHSEETKRKMRISNNQVNQKKVAQYTKNGVLIATYDSITEASKNTNVNVSQICSCCKNKMGFKTAGGFIWKYK